MLRLARKLMRKANPINALTHLTLTVKVYEHY
ncbi:hypothetical protein DPMD02_69 [Desulfofustis phage LS06-2018-MD02]|nr:hypothetical protein DPMD02_69 [Desulfofustis phage LS06-2018-MD02]